MPDRVLLSFDVEEFDAPIDFGGSIDEAQQLEISARGLEALLDLLDELDVSATLFTTAHFALGRPELMLRARGRHEVASHGYRHGSLEAGDLERSREALENLIGEPVRGFRRARFAATDAGEIRAAGYAYDSSEHPTWIPGRYNNLRGPRTPYRRDGLLHLPLSVSPRLRVPLFWLSFKHLPLPVFKALSRGVLRSDGQLLLCFHPWEFADPGDVALPWYVRRRAGPPMLERLAGYLRWLKERASFCTCGEFEREFS